jgi:hypothetical protein
MIRLLPATLALWLGLGIGTACAVEVPTCERIRAQAKNYTMKQIAALAKRARLTSEQWKQVEACLKDKR